MILVSYIRIDVLNGVVDGETRHQEIRQVRAGFILTALANFALVAVNFSAVIEPALTAPSATSSPTSVPGPQICPNSAKLHAKAGSGHPLASHPSSLNPVTTESSHTTGHVWLRVEVKK